MLLNIPASTLSAQPKLTAPSGGRFGYLNRLRHFISFPFKLLFTVLMPVFETFLMPQKIFLNTKYIRKRVDMALLMLILSFYQFGFFYFSTINMSAGL